MLENVKCDKLIFKYVNKPFLAHASAFADFVAISDRLDRYPIYIQKQFKDIYNPSFDECSSVAHQALIAFQQELERADFGSLRIMRELIARH
jgi:hypothetical protein